MLRDQLFVLDLDEKLGLQEIDDFEYACGIDHAGLEQGGGVFQPLGFAKKKIVDDVEPDFLSHVIVSFSVGLSFGVSRLFRKPFPSTAAVDEDISLWRAWCRCHPEFSAPVRRKDRLLRPGLPVRYRDFSHKGRGPSPGRGAKNRIRPALAAWSRYRW